MQWNSLKKRRGSRQRTISGEWSRWILYRQMLLKKRGKHDESIWRKRLKWKCNQKQKRTEAMQRRWLKQLLNNMLCENLCWLTVKTAALALDNLPGWLSGWLDGCWMVGWLIFNNFGGLQHRFLALHFNLCKSSLLYFLFLPF